MPFMSRARSKLSYSNIGMTACLLLLMAVVGAGQAYAVASITGAEVVDESLTEQTSKTIRWPPGISAPIQLVTAPLNWLNRSRSSCQ